MTCSRKSASLILAVAALAFLANSAAQAQSKQILVTQPINNSLTVTLTGNTRPEVNPVLKTAAVATNQKLPHLMLLLKRPAALDAQLTAFIDELHNPASPNFHKWISAEQFGAQFGPAQSDIAAVTSWLESQGFAVNVVYANGMFIDFSGTVGQVETAFHTQINNYDINGVGHFANATDPQIPAALGQIIGGIISLNDFKPKALHEHIQKTRVAPNSHTLTTNYDNANGEELVPWDLERIYNIAPLYSAGISGQGMTIVVLEDTNLFNCNAANAAGNSPGTPCSATSDWAAFRNTFGLGRYTAGSLSQENPAPQTGANNCSTPGTTTGYPTGVNSDDIEAAIDVEWATAAAPSATIVNAACANPRGGFGGLTALQNILSHPNADNVDVVSMSYGESEESSGAAFNAAFNTTFQQAVAAGIAIFVSSGDEDAASTDGGGADCTGFPPADNGDYGCATHGITISGWMSSPYDVSVGGLDFADTYLGLNASYWNAANNVWYGSAKSYIMEQPWNDSCAGTLVSNFIGFATTYGPDGFCNSSIASDPTDPTSNFLIAVGGSGGPSACATGTAANRGVANGTCAGWPKPSYQSSNLGLLAGLQNDGVRDTPDVSLMAANGLWGHYYAVCYSNTLDTADGGTPCVGQPVNWPGFGGTSVSSPIFAAIQSLVVQHKGSLQGNPNPRYYALAAAEYGPSGNSACDSSLGNATGSSCIFHDVTLGDNDADCQNDGTHTFDCYFDGGNVGVLSTSNTAYQPAYLTTTGWDFASGIGSVNAYNLVFAY
ncbi:MAG: protease pro-enzyme activation domain-containing protein [Terracidiphilus sp.]|jgi:subtilase family serine protease